MVQETKLEKPSEIALLQVESHAEAAPAKATKEIDTKLVENVTADTAGGSKENVIADTARRSKVDSTDVKENTEECDILGGTNGDERDHWLV